MRRISLILALALLLIIPVGCRTVAEESDAARFKKEYEILNGQSNLDGSHQYQELSIPDDNPFVYVEAEDLYALFESGDGVLYLGFAECPWCRTLLPALLDAKDRAGYDGSIYYYNAVFERDTRTLGDNGTVIVEDMGSELYQFLLSELYDHLDPYAGLDDETIKRIYFPSTAFVRAGEAASVHLVTVDSQSDGYQPLDDEQYAELVDLLTAQFQAIMP